MCSGAALISHGWYAGFKGDGDQATLPSNKRAKGLLCSGLISLHKRDKRQCGPLCGFSGHCVRLHAVNRLRTKESHRDSLLVKLPVTKDGRMGSTITHVLSLLLMVDMVCQCRPRHRPAGSGLKCAGSHLGSASGVACRPLSRTPEPHLRAALRPGLRLVITTHTTCLLPLVARITIADPLGSGMFLVKPLP